MARSYTVAGAKRLWIRLAASGRRHLDYAIDIAVDAALGVKTFVPVPAEPIDTTARNGRYESLPYRSLRVIRRHLRPSRRDVVLDIGCGKGRVLCLFALHCAGRCAGIEVSSELAAEATVNAGRLRYPHSPIEVTNVDAAEAAIGDASIVFMYNPFSAPVMRTVLAHVGDSLRRAPRELRICYANPVEAAVLDECPWLVCTDEFMVMHNGWRAAPVKIWTARPDLLESQAAPPRH